MALCTGCGLLRVDFGATSTVPPSGRTSHRLCHELNGIFRSGPTFFSLGPRTVFPLDPCTVTRGSSVSIVSGYGLDDRAIEVRSPAEAKEFFL
jgi:hypothetical protein